MDPSLYETIAPNALFFSGFFIVFSLVEIAIILLLERIESHHLDFMVDIVMKDWVHYSALIRLITIWSILLFASLLLLFSPILYIFIEATASLWVFAVLLFLVIILIYFVTTRKILTLKIERRIHRAIYIFLSLPLFVLVMFFADANYVTYQEYVNKKLVDPLVISYTAIVDEQEKNRLLVEFRSMIAEDQCPFIDYRDRIGDGKFRQFVYVELDLDLATSDEPYDPEDVPSIVRGRVCSEGIDSFILTERGAWFWVFE